MVFRADYASCSGADANDQADPGPGLGVGNSLADQYNSGGWNLGNVFTGCFFQASSLRLTDITRGTSNVFMFGEKSLNPQNYYTGLDGGDNEAAYVGFDNDNCRSTLELPVQDNPITSDTFRFGSAHVGVG